MRPSVAVMVLVIGAVFPFQRGYADTLYLHNGRQVEGIIEREDKDKIELNVGFGTVTFRKDRITKIYKSSSQESEVIKERWMERKQTEARRQVEEERKPKEVAIENEDSGHIVVEALLNGKVSAKLIVDTGASLFTITHAVALKLGINPDEIKEHVELQVANGEKVQAKFFLLESVRVESMVVNDVPAAIMPENITNAGFKDGLCGMSFLGRFKLTIDQAKKKLTLEKL